MHYQIDKHFANVCYILGPWMNWFGGPKHQMWWWDSSDSPKLNIDSRLSSDGPGFEKLSSVKKRKEFKLLIILVDTI